MYREDEIGAASKLLAWSGCSHLVPKLRDDVFEAFYEVLAGQRALSFTGGAQAENHQPTLRATWGMAPDA